MGKKLTAYDAKEYVLSCGHNTRLAYERIQNTCICTKHYGYAVRVFILEVIYDRDSKEAA